MTNYIRALLFFGVLLAVLFGSAGRWDLPFFWAYVFVTLASAVVGFLTVDTGLQQERWYQAVRNREFWFMVLIGMPLFIGSLAVAGFDLGRFHWSGRIPLGVQIAGLLLLALGWGFTTWAVAVNRFFSPVVRIQTERGHHLIATGPYRYVRHPGYAGAIAAFLGGAVALGSWWALAPAIPLSLIILGRAAVEDRFLRTQLPGYATYAHDVRYRLLPPVW